MDRDIKTKDRRTIYKTKTKTRQNKDKKDKGKKRGKYREENIYKIQDQK
jgi:hypothetical protein